MWVFLVFAEVPSSWTFAGGALLVCTLAMHEADGFLRARTVCTKPSNGLKEPFLASHEHAMMGATTTH